MYRHSSVVLNFCFISVKHYRPGTGPVLGQRPLGLHFKSTIVFMIYSRQRKHKNKLQTSTAYGKRRSLQAIQYTTRTWLQRHSVSLFLEIRSTNEGAINSARNRIYSPKVFYFLVYRRRYFLLVSELIQYVFQRRPEIRLQSQAIRVYKYTKIQGPRFQRNYIIARDQKSYLQGTSFQSSPKINRMLITRAICIQ